MKLGAFSIILNEDKKILLCHRRDKDLWNLPGGKVEDDEFPWSAAIREAKEEIGVSVVLNKLLFVNFKLDADELVFTFDASIVSGIPGVSDEVDIVSYFDITNLPLNIAPKQKERINEFFSKNPRMFFSQ